MRVATDSGDGGYPLDSEAKKLTYFQFRKDLNIPLFVRSVDWAASNPLFAFLKEMGFSELNADELAKLEQKKVDAVPFARMI